MRQRIKTMHKSIFKKVEKYYSNPLDEYLKIKSFIYKTPCYYSDNIFKCFATMFSYCEPLRKVYSDLYDCINNNISYLNNYSNPVGNDVYEGFENETKEVILDEFLTYIEIIMCMLCVLRSFGLSVFAGSKLNKIAMTQLEEMIETSLKSINYKIIEKSVDNIEIIKIDPISEYVAEQSSPTMRTAILNYLSTRDNDVSGKERSLHDIIDLLEPLFNKYGNVSTIRIAREFSQIIRHPEEKKKDARYQWFYQNKKEFLDKLFSLCIFTQQYSMCKDTAEEFELKKL